MARSVSYPRDCIAVCFRDVSDIECPEDWHDYVDQLRNSAFEA